MVNVTINNEYNFNFLYCSKLSFILLEIAIRKGQYILFNMVQNTV